MQELLREGDCLLERYEKKPYRIIRVEPGWYYTRCFKDGRLKVIPSGEVPYSYSPIGCPPQRIPPPPLIKVGDCVEWTEVSKAGKKKVIKRGIVKDINGKGIGKVEIEMEKELMGVRGLAWRDIYELRLCKEEHLESVVDYDRRYSLEELKQMCKDKGVSNSGDKKTLARRLIG